jgi:acetolactate synthase-1/2/3 large subunit
MQNMPIYEALAQAFAAEDVDTHFTLMGDGNMHWATAMKNLDGMSTFHARHEHCACAMAMGYHLATGRVGVASVTCGPGFTQIMTALTTAARARVPLVVFAGEAPMHAKWYNQALDQPPFAAASGAHYISAHSPQRMHQYVREAFYVARHERKPVVLGVPYDLQKQPLPNLGAYQPSSDRPIRGRSMCWSISLPMPGARS